jgi:hypothetical protein
MGCPRRRPWTELRTPVCSYPIIVTHLSFNFLCLLLLYSNYLNGFRPRGHRVQYSTPCESGWCRVDTPTRQRFRSRGHRVQYTLQYFTAPREQKQPLAMRGRKVMHWAAFSSHFLLVRGQGVTKRCRLSWLTNSALV